MSLEIMYHDGSQRNLEDTEILGAGEWRRMLGIHHQVLILNAADAGYFADPVPFPQQRRHQYPVSFLPHLINALSEKAQLSRQPNPVFYYHAWARGIDTSKDFEVTPPSLLVRSLRYRYPQTDPIE